MCNPISRTGVLLSLILALITVNTTVKAVNTALIDKPEVKQFIVEMATKPEFTEQELTDLFQQVEIQQSIINSMNRPYEARPWHNYRQLFITEKRINDGVVFWQENEETLKRAEQEFGVPGNIIVAIIGVETAYGRI